MATVTVERILEERDVDAALYLLRRMLGLRDDVVGKRRTALESLRRQIAQTRTISHDERKEVVAAYRDIIG